MITENTIYDTFNIKESRNLIYDIDNTLRSDFKIKFLTSRQDKHIFIHTGTHNFKSIKYVAVGNKKNEIIFYQCDLHIVKTSKLIYLDGIIIPSFDMNTNNMITICFNNKFTFSTPSFKIYFLDKNTTYYSYLPLVEQHESDTIESNNTISNSFVEKNESAEKNNLSGTSTIIQQKIDKLNNMEKEREITRTKQEALAELDDKLNISNSYNGVSINNFTKIVNDISSSDEIPIFVRDTGIKKHHRDNQIYLPTRAELMEKSYKNNANKGKKNLTNIKNNNKLFLNLLGVSEENIRHIYENKLKMAKLNKIKRQQKHDHKKIDYELNRLQKEINNKYAEVKNKIISGEIKTINPHARYLINLMFELKKNYTIMWKSSLLDMINYQLAQAE